MTREELLAFVGEFVPERIEGVSTQFPEVFIPADKLAALARELKTNPKTKMDFLFCETAADRKDGFHMVYFMSSTVYHHALELKVIVTDKENPVIATVSDLWKSAEFFEREIYDLFGIRFENHPDLRRIFLEDDWVGYPLRKDYKDSFTITR